MMASHPGAEQHNLLVEEGSNRSAVLVVFSGFAGRWGSGRYEFLDSTGSLRYSRILCRDPDGLAYHGEIDPAHPGLEGTLQLLRWHLQRLAPQTTVLAGNSVGGYAALLFGHLLQADAVHAFAPLTNLTREYVTRQAPPKTPEGIDAYERLWSLPHQHATLLDLRAVLAIHNRRTRYFVHYCERNDTDRHAAELLAGTDGVTLLPQPCRHHLVSRHLQQRRLLLQLLHPDNQHRVLDIMRSRHDA